MANTDKMSEEKVVKLEAEKSDRKDQVCGIARKLALCVSDEAKSL